MQGHSKFEGWEKYPENLQANCYDAYRYNLRSYSQQISNNTSDLFVKQNERIGVMVVDIDDRGKNFSLRVAPPRARYLRVLFLAKIAPIHLVKQRMIEDAPAFEDYLEVLMKD